MVRRVVLALLLAVTVSSLVPGTAQPARMPYRYQGNPVRSYVLVATEELWLANGYPGLRADTTPVRIQIAQWYAAPDRWRLESSYLVPPAQPALRGAFLPGPDIAVRNGRVYRTYDASSHTTTVQMLPPGAGARMGPSVFLSEAAAAGSPVPPASVAPVGDLRAYLARLSACDAPKSVLVSRPKLIGRDAVAGHVAYVIDMGNRPCGWNSASAPEQMGRRLIWVDQHTFFLLKLVRYSVLRPHQLFERLTVTHLQYSVHIDPARFTLQVPPGARVVSGSPPTTPATVRPLRDIRRRVSFPIFVPTWWPGKLAHSQTTLDGAEHVTIDVETTRARITVLEGPLGCCLDADPRKYDGAAALPRGRTAYLLDGGAAYGGLILWWDQDGTYVAVSGIGVSRADLVRIAASASRTATL